MRGKKEERGGRESEEERVREKGGKARGIEDGARCWLEIRESTSH